MTVPAVITPLFWSWKLVPSGVLHPSVKSVSSTGSPAGGVISTLKVLPASSQSLLTSVTVTVASASMPSSQFGVPSAHSRPAGGLTLKVCVVLAVAPTSSVTVSVTVTSVSSVNVYVWVGFCSVEVLSGLEGSPKSQAWTRCCRPRRCCRR